MQIWLRAWALCVDLLITFAPMIGGYLIYLHQIDHARAYAHDAEP